MIAKLATSAVTVTAVALAALTLVPSLLGYQHYTILTGSMDGSYDTGSVVYAKQVPTSQLRVGDVITYAPPRSAGVATDLVTHRIAAIRRVRGTRVFRTKGDANAAADPWRFRLDQPTQARVAFGVPFLGRALAALSRRRTRMLLIGIPALIVALVALTGIVRDVRRGRATDAAATEVA